MTHYVHTLTDLESACGVTLEDVARDEHPVQFRGFNELGLAVYRVAN